MTPSSNIPNPGETTPQEDVLQSRASGWSFAHRVIFRFVFSFLVLCNFPFPFSTNPGSVYDHVVRPDVVRSSEMDGNSRHAPAPHAGRFLEVPLLGLD